MEVQREVRRTRIVVDGVEELMNLEEWLAHRGLKKSQFAKLVGVTPVTVSRWISGERHPQGYLVGNICHVLDCSWSEISWPERVEKTSSSPLERGKERNILTNWLRVVKTG